MKFHICVVDEKGLKTSVIDEIGTLDHLLDFVKKFGKIEIGSIPRKDRIKIGIHDLFDLRIRIGKR